MRSANAIRLMVALVLLIAGASWAQSYGEKKYGEYFEEEKAWVEAETVLPDFPKTEDLLGFFVSAASPNKYYIAPRTISVAADGVVRYAAIVNTPNGVTNVSFEGLRCATKEIRLYAFGHADGTWGKSRNDRWLPVRPGSYQAVLFKEYFCPRGVAIFSAEEGIDALRQGVHPMLK